MSHRSLSCASLPAGFSTIALVQSCDQVKNGSLRLQTLFKYPDGSDIDLFLEEGDIIHPYKLTDYGSTRSYLLDLPMDPWAVKKRKNLVASICKDLNVETLDGELFIHLTKDELVKASIQMVRLSQACIRIADLGMTKRYKMTSSFRDDFEEFVANQEYKYEIDTPITGRFGNIVRVDFSIEGARTRNLINTISTLNPTSAHQVANEVFTKWYDLDDFRKKYSFISVYDSENSSFRDEDLSRLSTVSTVLSFPAQAEAIQEALAA